eukprot:21221-Heterococcus_DN1.PRE.2
MDLETTSPRSAADTELPARTGAAAKAHLQHTEQLYTGFEIAEDIRQVSYKCSSSGLPPNAKPRPGKIVENSTLVSESATNHLPLAASPARPRRRWQPQLCSVRTCTASVAAL